VAALQAAHYQGIWSLECYIAENNEEKLKAELAQAKALFV